MFTTLTVINTKQEKIKQLKKRKYISEENRYKDYTFYTTRLLTKKINNDKSISSFKSRAQIPVITENSFVVYKYRFIALANTVLSSGKTYRNIGIYDKSGSLNFLLPFLSNKCGSISIFTNNPAAYTDICTEIYYEYGTPVVVNDKKENVINSNIIFSAEKLSIGPNCPVITADNSFILSLNLKEKFFLPDYCDPFLIAAGLFFYGGFREFGELKVKKD